jgi:hypothetical protein
MVTVKGGLAHHRFVIISPRDLITRLTRVHGQVDLIQTYFWVTDRHRCWEGRGVSRANEVLMAQGFYRNPERDFTTHLNAWQLVGSRLRLAAKRRTG